MTTHDAFASGNNDEQRKIGLAASGPIFLIEIAESDLIGQELSSHIPPPSEHGPALIDTGADITCVDSDVIANLGLFPNGQVYTYTSTGGFITLTYPVSLTIPDARSGVRFESLTVVGLDLRSGISGHRDLHALVGRDVLQEFEFFFDGPKGRWALTCDKKIIRAE